MGIRITTNFVNKIIGDGKMFRSGKSWVIGEGSGRGEVFDSKSLVKVVVR